MENPAKKFQMKESELGPAAPSELCEQNNTSKIGLRQAK
jgi:hypothetical protein